MSKVVLELSMSLDGFIAGPNDNPDNGLGDGGDALFKWYSSGDTDFPLPGTDMVFKISRASAEFLRPSWLNIGASVTGRRTFDIARGWGGNPLEDAMHHILSSPIPFHRNGSSSARRSHSSRTVWRALLKKRRRRPEIQTSILLAQVLRSNASKQAYSTKYRSTWLLSCSEQVFGCLTTWATGRLTWNHLPSSRGWM